MSRRDTKSKSSIENNDCDDVKGKLEEIREKLDVTNNTLQEILKEINRTIITKTDAGENNEENRTKETVFSVVQFLKVSVHRDSLETRVVILVTARHHVTKQQVHVVVIASAVGGRQEAFARQGNIALNKRASTTSGVHSNWSPSNAVDGNSDIYGGGRTCFHANKSPSDWRVDLGRDFQLYDIRIYSRGGYYWRNANSNIYLNDDPSSICSTLPSPTDTPNPTDVTCNGTGISVTIRNPGLGPGHTDALNICEVQIYVCSTGVYGVNCDKFCHCLNSTCDRWTGLCPGGCRPGWQEQKCDTACNSTTYGIDCHKTCAGRKCSATSSSCDRHTGTCDTGCLPGWTEVDCTQECTSGKYGENCTSLCTERQCAGNSSCDHVTGSCDFGCRAGWMGADCKEECDSNNYGSNCLGICSSRNCDGNSSCNSTGACDSGCLTGWTQDDCTECDSKHYGSKCEMRCSSRHCLKNSSCNAAGVCDGGCEAGWTRDDCTEKVVTHIPSQKPEGESFPIAAVVGVVVGVVVILLLVLAVILIRRRREKSHGRSTHKPAADNVTPTQAEDGMYMNVGFENNKPPLSPEKTSAKQIKALRKNTSQGNSAGKAASSTGSKITDKGDGRGEEDHDASELPEQAQDSPEDPEEKYYNLDNNGGNRLIPVSELQTRVKEMTLASAEEEFKRLPDSYVHSYDESQQPKNKGKNRFRGYYPYDYNRVVLHDVGENKDYINASYLDGYKAEKRYIAAQGPYRPEVVEDFWRMIYQEQSTAIVMVTGLVEAGKRKCLQYWPEKGTSTYGDISVTKETENQLANYTVTKLSVHNKSEGKIHLVHHFHFTSWPDHCVPDTSALLEFMWRVKSTTRHQTQPIIVHCSAGIGRTGTYIAMECLVDQAAAEGFVDVVSFVTNMRGQRKNMIQTKEQYLFLYQAVAMAVSEGDTSLDADTIRQIDLSHVSSVTMGNKNVQEHLEALKNASESRPGDHTTTVASYTSRKGFFIMTSQPDKEELWNQVYNSDSRTLMTLAAENQIFLPSMDSPVSTSRLTATLQASKVISNDVVLNTICLTANGADVTTFIQHYHVTGSTHEPSVTLLIDSLLTWMSDPERGSCTIISNSVSEARFLVLLVNIASRLQDDSRVDVISNMRRLHASLGGPPFSQEDVRRCLEFAQGRLESLGLYANL